MFWQLLFWLLMALWLILLLFGGMWPAGSGWQPRAHGGLLWVLLAILGSFAIGMPK